MDNLIGYSDAVESLSHGSAQNMPCIAAFGGGTGLSTLLRGLKTHTHRINAVVTVCDSGGSSGRLKREFDMLAPGDIRNCLASLADTEPLMTELLQYRFGESELAGHSFGNLLITALTRITGDFGSAVRAANKILKVKGDVLPSTLDRVSLVALHPDGSKTTGEKAVGKSAKPITDIELKPDSGNVTDDVLRAIANADMLVFGPGSLYTSIIPNLLIGGILDALESSTAVRVYICNVMTQPGETTGYTAAMHVDAIEEHSREGFFDYVVVNNGSIPAGIAEKYMRNGQYPVRIDRENLENRGFELVESDILSRNSYARHDAARTAGLLMQILASVSKRGSGCKTAGS